MRTALLGIGALCVAVSARAQTVSRTAPHYQVATSLAGGGVLPNQVTLTPTQLVGNFPRGSVSLTMRLVNLAWGTGVMQVWLTPGKSQLQMDGDSGKVRIRYNFTFGSGQTTPATLTLHGGQLPTDPVVGSCTITTSAPRCETVVDAMGPWWLTATLDNGSAVTFVNATAAPTP